MVSIVMCTYNGEKFLREQLDSVIHQTYTPIELIICDDASTDTTFDLLQEYKVQYPWIQVYKNEKNLGYNKNFLKGFSYCSGENIAVCDQDDIWELNKIELMMDAWKPGVPLIYCNSIMFEKTIPKSDKVLKLSRRYEGTDARNIGFFNTVSGHAMIFKKDLLPLIYEHFPGDIYYDWWLAVFASYHGGVQYLPKILVYQRRHGENASGGRSDGYQDKQYRQKFNEKMLAHFDAFKKIPGKTEAHQDYFNKQYDAWKDVMDKPFSKKLLRFIMQNRHTVFYRKKRKVGFFSHLKHAFRLATNKGYQSL